jgi:hypothetical protein
MNQACKATKLNDVAAEFGPIDICIAMLKPLPVALTSRSEDAELPDEA